jgi:peptidoglycan hydrolase CwlO-like protein
MKLLFIILAQSTTGPIIEIILLLVGALLIGFFTAWFYQKSVFTPIILRLEAEKEDLNKKIDGLNKRIDDLNNEISGLKRKVADLEKVISEKEKEIAELKKPKK